MALEFHDTAGIASGSVFECEDGWRGLIAKAAAEVAEVDRMAEGWNVRIVGGWVTDGALTLQISYDGRWPYEVVKLICDEYRAKSMTICEVCGRPGRLRSSIAATRCDDHA
ncbi:hypothetical protein GUK30_32800 [Rhizobium leguminosarum]|uniref:hypothetical protein n=1 Tax=Rhizobium ruizarguesonis TaxID=2081791 RepID=UPI0013C071D3|nr:hypothetical protein [Rhizobium ruizarguesonis]NEI24127.1 hypothetical protein [Rhizobium ruizarguesonis]